MQKGLQKYIQIARIATMCNSRSCPPLCQRGVGVISQPLGVEFFCTSTINRSMLRPNLYDYLKILALIAMIVDHVGFLWYPDVEVLRVVGRLAFPIFLFLVWYNRSYRSRPRLWVWGIVFQIWLRLAARQWYIDIRYANILLGIAATRVILSWIQHQNHLYLEVLIWVIALIYASQTQQRIEYGSMSLVFGLIGYRSRGYGATMPMYVVIAWWVIWHMLWSQQWLHLGDDMLTWMWLVWLILLWCLLAITKSNSPLIPNNTKIQATLVRISRHSLELYVVQAVILGVLSVV